MEILHPIFLIIFLILLVGAFYEEMREVDLKIVVIVSAVLMIIASGFRSWVGADYPVYARLFPDFTLYVSNTDVFNKAIFMENKLEIEWLYVLLNRVVFGLGLPFYVVTFVMALAAISLKLKTIYDYAALPLLGVLYYFTQLFFFEDSGQIRQGIGSAICFFSFRYIVKRDLKKFLLCIYIALGFHKTAIVFLPAYWLVLVPMNSQRLLGVIILSILLSPFEVYRLAGGLFTTLMPQDISNGYEGYVKDTYYGTERQSGVIDLLYIVIFAMIIIYDKMACRKILYYEYMRNLAVFGFCLTYIFKMNQIFSLRLPGVYLTYLLICFPSLIYSLQPNQRRLAFYGFTSFLLVLFLYFGSVTAGKARFTWGKYDNYLFLR